jgi:hypothetical protein
LRFAKGKRERFFWKSHMDNNQAQQEREEVLTPQPGLFGDFDVNPGLAPLGHHLAPLPRLGRCGEPHPTTLKPPLRERFFVADTKMGVRKSERRSMGKSGGRRLKPPLRERGSECE